MSKKIQTTILVLFVLALGWWAFRQKYDLSLGGFGTQQSSGGTPNSVPATVDVSGTGTSSLLSYNWGGPEQGQFATTSLTTRFGSGYSALDINVWVETASTTILQPLTLEILKSDVADCNLVSHASAAWTDLQTTRTSATKSHNYTTGTTTYKYIPAALANVNTGITINLTSISAECLKIYAHAASTTAWIQAKKH